MTRVFVDTNVLLDVLLRREPFVLQSAAVLELGSNGEVALYTSALSLVNCLYVGRKVVGYDEILGAVRKLREFVRVSPMGAKEVDAALGGDAADAEDVMQYRSALAAGCKVLVTRNKKDFSFAKIPIYTPEEFCERYW